MGAPSFFSGGRIAAIWRYPVKSMAGESISYADISWHGVSGDRRWGFLRPHHESHGFPWLTIREQSRMCLFTARLLTPERPDASSVIVRTPDGLDLAVADPPLLDMLGTGLRLMRLHRGVFDSMPLSLIGTATVAALCHQVGANVDARRFRPNLLIETNQPFIENEWVGSTLQVADATIRVDRRDPRCDIVNIDPRSTARTSDMLRHIATHHQNRAGVYASVATPGRVRVGDDLRTR